MRDIRLILLLAVWWWIGGAVMGVGVRAYFAVDWIIPCGFLNLLLGMFVLLVVHRDQQARARLYGESNREMPLHVGLVLLVGAPVILIFTGLLWLVMGWLLAR